MCPERQREAKGFLGGLWGGFRRLEGGLRRSQEAYGRIREEALGRLEEPQGGF